MKPAPGILFMPAILKRLAPRLGAKVIWEPENKIVGLIQFPNGRKSYFWHNKFNLNSISSAKIAQDKGYTGFFLKKLGFRVPHTKTFFRQDFAKKIASGRTMEDGLRFAESIGWPVFVKPCSRSQGLGVSMAANKKDFLAAARAVFACDRVMLVQAACAGRDYRIVVLDGEVISAYERVPLTVYGNGRHTLKQLLDQLQKEFTASGRDTIIPVDDPRINMRLQRNELSLACVPKLGEAVQLLDVANLSLGGTTVDITEKLHASFSRLAAKVADAMDLRFAGIDLMAADATKPASKYAILEVNSAPGLDHYGSSGKKHEAHIDELYLKVLQAVARGSRR